MKIALSIPGFPNIDTGNPSLTPLPTGVPTGGLFGKGTEAIVVFINFIIIVAILLSLYYIVRGGMNLITSGGDKQKFQSGRERIRYAIIGLLVIFFSFALVNIISTLFGFNLLFFTP